MKSIKQVVRSIGNAHSKKCVSTPNKWNSCEPCKDCRKPANYGQQDLPPMTGSFELREDGTFELREDDSFELRQ